MHELPKLKPDEVIVYLRKSQSDDVAMPVTKVLEKHESILNEWAIRSLGQTVPETNKFREVVSGETLSERPEMLKVLRMIENPRYKAVAVVDVQRLSRGDLEDIGYMIKIFKHTDTLIITPNNTYNLQNEYDNDIIEMELKRGNDYLKYTKKILQRGREASIKKGDFIGSISPYGYDKDVIVIEGKKHHTLKINPVEAEAVRLAFDLYVNENMGFIKIAKHLQGLGFPTRKGGNWTAYTVISILENVHYIGKVKWNFRETKTVIVDGTAKKTRPRAKDYLIVDGLHPAIVSEDLYYMAQEKKGKNPKIRQALTIRNIFAGLLFCGKCGKAIVYKDDRKTPPRLVCNSQVHCGNVSVLYSDIISRVQRVLKDSIEDFTVKLAEDTSDTAKAHESQIQELSKRLELLKDKEVKQWDLYSQGAMPPEIFEKLNEQLKADKESTLQALEFAQKTAPTPQEYQERIYRFTDALNALNDENLSVEKKNALLKACIDRMEYRKEKGTRWDVKPIILDIKLRL